MSVKFKKPQYIKCANANTSTKPSEPIPAYLFEIVPVSTDISIHIIVEPSSFNQECLTVDSILESAVNENPEKLLNLAKAFMESSSQYFTKPPTAEYLSRKFIHRTVSLSEPLPDSMPYVLSALPIHVIAERGNFILQWNCIINRCSIDIAEPDATAINQPTAQTPPQVSNPESYITALPGGTTEIEVFDDAMMIVQSTENPDLLKTSETMQRVERNKLREAKMRAKLAQYKAEKLYVRYRTKYGNSTEESDTETNSDSDTSDKPDSK